MARTRHLPLYAATYAFSREVYRIKVKLPKALKYDLGQEKFTSAIKILKCVVIVNASKERLNILDDCWSRLMCSGRSFACF